MYVQKLNKKPQTFWSFWITYLLENCWNSSLQQQIEITDKDSKVFNFKQTWNHLNFSTA